MCLQPDAAIITTYGELYMCPKALHGMFVIIMTNILMISLCFTP